jgi:hypothetical protein
MNEIVYGLIDSNGVLLNPVVAGDEETLEQIKNETEFAVGYAILDPEVYLIRVGMLKWNGTYWEKAL